MLPKILGSVIVNSNQQIFTLFLDKSDNSYWYLKYVFNTYDPYTTCKYEWK